MQKQSFESSDIKEMLILPFFFYLWIKCAVITALQFTEYRTYVPLHASLADPKLQTFFKGTPQIGIFYF